MKTRRILLIEPGYPNKYPPLGLMKLATHHGPDGQRDEVQFTKGQDPTVLLQEWDRVYVTTLFSFEWKRTAAAIDHALLAARGQAGRVFVGGIAASLMPGSFAAEPRWNGVRFITGILDGTPATALRLEPGEQRPGDGGTPVEEQVPDYSILDQADYRYPVVDAYFGYATRGCVRKCSFCGVPRLEGGQRDGAPLTGLVHGVAARHGEKRDLVLMDNNVTASPSYRAIIDEIESLGFGAGATIRRNGRTHKRRVDFNQGLDARILAKSPMFLREMSRICVSPLRIAFDHLGVRGPYEKAVRMAAQNGLTSLSNYMLYNFMDSPPDLYRRMRLNIELNAELGLRIWSFPMRYQPVDLRDRSHTGPYWSRYTLRSFQIMMQATHGVVPGDPAFFEYAYGGTEDEFTRLLASPHKFLFHREYYRSGDGQPQREEYESLLSRMSQTEHAELRSLLAPGPRERELRALGDDTTLAPSLRAALAYHRADPRPGRTARAPQPPHPPEQMKLTDMPVPEEMVEDAGLFDSE